jgi:hypothetical protein
VGVGKGLSEDGNGRIGAGGFPGAWTGVIETERVCKLESEANVEVSPINFENGASKQSCVRYMVGCSKFSRFLG